MARKYDTLGLLGMTEMELAVEFILDLAEEKKLPLNEVVVYPLAFTFQNSKRDGLLTGVIHLAYRELIEPNYPNGVWKVTQKLIEIMRKRECWKDLPDALSFQEFFDKAHPNFFWKDRNQVIS